MKRSRTLFIVMTMALTARSAIADPCGMVPPFHITGAVPIERVGLQKTYVFYKNGIETFVIRPGYRGDIDNFGMLIPFPTPPAIRKVPDAIFSHIAAAVDPPEVVVDLRPRRRLPEVAFFARSLGDEKKLEFETGVRVLRQEAIGMYQVAVLEAGSASALKQWMDDNGYRYPTGMDKVCEEYVDSSWCFVAVKTRVGQKAGVDPRPGQREVDSNLPASSTFDGNVQAMGFRFVTKDFVLPMRLSAFNEGETRNVVYVLTDKPKKIDQVPEAHVVRQISGGDLYKNLTGALPLRVLGGAYFDIPTARRDTLGSERNPEPHNGLARDLFASDLLTARRGALSHEFEEREKELLKIGERLGLRGLEMDTLLNEALAEERARTIREALVDLKAMTLTVVDGDFPREALARENLTFSSYSINTDKNQPRSYDAKSFGPTPEKEGKVYKAGFGFSAWWILLIATAALGIAAARALRKTAHTPEATFSPLSRTGGRTSTCAVPESGRCGSGGTEPSSPASKESAFPREPFASQGDAARVEPRPPGARRTAHGEVRPPARKTVTILALAIAIGLGGTLQSTAPSRPSDFVVQGLIERLNDPARAEEAASALAALGEEAITPLLGEALEGNNLSRRGWAIVCLAEIGGADVDRRLIAIHEDPRQPALVRTWGAAARVTLAKSTNELVALAKLVPTFPALGRTIGKQFLAVIDDGTSASVEELIEISFQVPNLAQTLAAPLLSRGPEALAQAMVTAKNQATRRQAAGFLATLALQGGNDVATAVIALYRFDPERRAIPWQGGPLFVPGISWKKNDARDLTKNLIKWFVFCERNDLNAEKRQLHNNLRSIQLARAAGYQPASRPILDAWLKTWKQAYGTSELSEILQEQGVAKEPRYIEILEGR